MVSCKFVQNLKHNFSHINISLTVGQRSTQYKHQTYKVYHFSHINISFTVGQRTFVLVWNKLSEVFYSLKQRLMPIFVVSFVEGVGNEPDTPLSNVLVHAQVERELLQLSVVREEVPHGGRNLQQIRFLLFLQSQNRMSQLLLFTTKCREGHL